MSFAGLASQELLDCLRTELQARPNVPAYIMLRAGREVTPLLSTVQDECCQGLAWVRFAGAELAQTINPVTGQKCFGQGRQYALEMGVVRCAPTPGAGSIPTEAQWSSLFFQLDSDYDAMEAALCCLKEFVYEQADNVPLMAEYVPLGQDGNCIGGIMTITLEADCGCP